MTQPHPSPRHHFDEALLLDYAAGSLSEGLSVLVATHLALCPACRATVADAEAIGGALLDSLEPEALAPDALDKVLARIDAEAPLESAPQERRDGGLPPPLRDYLGDDLEALAWQSLAPGVELTPLQPRVSAGGTAAWPPGVEVALVRLAPEAVAPRHSHAGIEATVIVQGGFADDSGNYEQGDAWIVDAKVIHAPVGLPGEACLCLVYLDGPLLPSGDNHVASI